MAKLTYAQLEGAWIQAGGPRALAPVAAAIAEAESRGDPNATNPDDNNGTQTSWGLWQISNGTHSAPSPNWADPLTNARLAVAKWKAAKNFSPWGTFNSGAYKGFLSPGTTPDMGGIQTTAATAGSTGQPPTCQIWFGFTLPSVSLPIVGNVAGGQSEGICVLDKPQSRALAGAFFLVAGGIIMGLGFTLVIARKEAPVALALIGLSRGGAGRIAGLGKTRPAAAEESSPEPEPAPAAA